MKSCTAGAGLVACLLLMAGGGAAHAGKPHEHGAARMDVAVDGPQLSIELELPLDSLVGFERAPRTDAERRSAAAALARMRDGAALFRPDAAGQCVLAGAQADAPVLQEAGGSHGGHADLKASYAFRCKQPARLATLEILLFDAFPRVERIEVQAALPKGQRRSVLRRNARVVRLAP